MAWSSLGGVNLKREWDLFPQPAINSEVYRISQPSLGAVDGYFLLRPYYLLSNAVGAARRIYPSDDAKILTYSLPPEFQERDLGVRYWQVRLSGRARVLASQTWRVELEEFS